MMETKTPAGQRLRYVIAKHDFVYHPVLLYIHQYSSINSINSWRPRKGKVTRVVLNSAMTAIHALRFNCALGPTHLGFVSNELGGPTLKRPPRVASQRCLLIL